MAHRTELPQATRGVLPVGSVGLDATSVPSALAELLQYTFNASLALILLVLTAPAFLLVTVIVLVGDGRPLFYGGMRLGRNKLPFRMLKFRTLATGSDKKIGGNVLTQQERFAIRGGVFLRETRLDELPQLFNILLGHMNFVGPRPVRAEVYNTHCCSIPHYDTRFAVKPGLVGYSQVFTPHSTPKRIRALIDAQVLTRNSPVESSLFVAFTGLLVIRSTVQRIGRHSLKFFRTRVLRKFEERRFLARIRPRQAALDWEDSVGRSWSEPIADINESALCVVRTQKAECKQDSKIRLMVQVSRGYGTHRTKTAVCTAELQQVREVPSGFAHVLSYKAASPTSQYVIDQYLLRRSLSLPIRRLLKRQSKSNPVRRPLPELGRAEVPPARFESRAGVLDAGPRVETTGSFDSQQPSTAHDRRSTIDRD